VQDVYAAKGSKTFWHYNIGYYKKWGNSNITNYLQTPYHVVRYSYKTNDKGDFYGYN
jgi:hypothetical protein